MDKRVLIETALKYNCITSALKLIENSDCQLECLYVYGKVLSKFYPVKEIYVELLKEICLSENASI